MQTDDYSCTYCQTCAYILVNHWEGTVECQGCGLVLGDHLIDETEEVSRIPDSDHPYRSTRRAGDLRDDRKGDGGLALKISGDKTTLVGHEINDANYIMRMKPGEEFQLKARHLITQWANLLTLQKTILHKAEEIMMRVECHRKVLEGYGVEAMSAAALYFAAKVNFVDLLPTEYEKVTGISLKEIKRAAKVLKVYIEEMLPVDPPKYCKHLCDRLRLSQEVTSTAQAIIENIQNKKLLDGRNPKIIVSTAVLYAVQHSEENHENGKKCTLNEIAKHSKLEENIISNSFKDIYFYSKDIIPQWKGSLPYEQSLQG